MALDEAAEILNINEEELITRGYRVYTTLDNVLQMFAEDIYHNDKLFPGTPGSNEYAESALVVLNVHTLYVKKLYEHAGILLKIENNICRRIG